MKKISDSEYCRLREFFEYPGQPLVSAAYIVAIYDSPEEAGATGRHFKAAEENGQIPGAGNQATQAVKTLMGYRQHGSVDQVLKDLHSGWRRSVFPGNFPEAYESGQRKAKALEPELREKLTAWYGR
jgi:hypothetical protein